MHNLNDRLNTLKRDIALADGERARMRAHLAALSSGAPVPSPYAASFSFLSLRAYGAALAALVLLVSGTGVSQAASRALPGDFLYPVKVRVNEPVARALAPSASAKAEADIRHAEERLREVEVLAARSEEDARDVAYIAEEVATRLARAGARAQALLARGKEEDADRIRSRVEAARLAHADLLAAQAESVDARDAERLRALAAALAVPAESDEGDGAATATATAALMKQAPEADTSRSERLLRSREGQADALVERLAKELGDDGLPEASRAELSAELAGIEAERAEARRLGAEGAIEEASDAFARLERRAYRALTLLTSAREIGKKADDKEVIIRFGSDEPEASDSARLRTAEDDDDAASSTRRAPQLEFRIQATDNAR